jgi:hypothetical protein
MAHVNTFKDTTAPLKRTHKQMDNTPRTDDGLVAATKDNNDRQYHDKSVQVDLQEKPSTPKTGRPPKRQKVDENTVEYTEEKPSIQEPPLISWLAQHGANFLYLCS